jgi:hypothetical protein
MPQTKHIRRIAVEEKTMRSFISPRRTVARRAASVALIVVASTAFWAQSSTGRTSSPFAEFFGSWRGSGQVIGADGHSDRIRCRATYAKSGSGEALSQSLVCASDSYRFDIHSYVVAADDGVQGYWQETTRNVTGHLTGQLESGRFEGSISGTGFTAQLSLKTIGHKQAVSITPQGGDIAKVDIVLSRD